MNSWRVYLFQRFICESLWCLRLGGLLFTKRWGRNNVPGNSLYFFEKKRKALRALLTRYPFWVLGHTRLGWSEIEISRALEVKPEPKSKALIRLSIEAVEELMTTFNIPRTGCRATAEIELLRANLALMERDFKRAEEIFVRVLPQESSRQLPLALYKDCLERLAICRSVTAATFPEGAAKT